MFYFDKECIVNALGHLKSVMFENNINEINLTTSYCGVPEYYKDSKKDGKEWISYVFFGDDIENQDKINDIFRETDWASIGITGFEEAKVIKVTETDVELQLIGIIDEKDIPDEVKNQIKMSESEEYPIFGN
jgi:hypothetical protein